jgi:hypothetical protein
MLFEESPLLPNQISIFEKSKIKRGEGKRREKNVYTWINIS